MYVTCNRNPNPQSVVISVTIKVVSCCAGGWSVSTLYDNVWGDDEFFPVLSINADNTSIVMSSQFCSDHTLNTNINNLHLKCMYY